MKLTALRAMAFAHAILAVPVVDIDDPRDSNQLIAPEVTSIAPSQDTGGSKYDNTAVSVASSDAFAVGSVPPSDGAIHEIRGSSKTYKLQVAITGNRQHVGETYGHYLTDAIRNGLNERCPDKFGSKVCSKIPYEFGEIAYSSIYSGRGFWRKNAHMILEVYGSNFPSNAPGLREQFINHVAQVFGRSSELKVNCYEVHLRPKSCIQAKWAFGLCPINWYRFCNAPEYVEISLAPPEEAEEDYAFLRVRLHFNGDSREGKFDCVGSIGAIDAIVPDSKIMTYSHLVQAPVWGWTHCEGPTVSGDCEGRDVQIKFCGPW